MKLHSRQPTGAKVRIRPRLLAAVAALCIAAGTGRAQYVEDSIDVGGAWVGSLVYNSREDVIYGESESQGLLFAISCDNNAIIVTYQLMGALELVYDSADNKAWCSYDGPEQESLAVIDGTTHSIVKRIRMPGATIPVWDAVSDRVYVSCQTTNSVAVVDANGDSIVTYIPVGACPMKLYINTRRHKMYVLNSDAGTVSIVNMTTNQVIKTVSVGGYPNAGYYCRSADKFYSAGPHDECVVIGGLSDTVIARIPVPGTEDLLCATGNETAGIVFAGMFAGNSGYIIAIDAEADTVLYLHDLGHAFAQGLLYSAKSGYVYSANYEKSVSVLTGDGSRVVKEMPLGDAPFVIASAPTHSRLYVGNLNTRWVYVLRDTATGAIAEPQSPNPGSRDISVTPNPFTQSVAVVWSHFVKGGDVARVYGQDGRLVRQAQIPAGEARWVWDGRDDSGALLPPGVYVIEAGPGLRAKVVKLK
jgi:YVTN family beta-propeller protein